MNITGEINSLESQDPFKGLLVANGKEWKGAFILSSGSESDSQKLQVLNDTTKVCNPTRKIEFDASRSWTGATSVVGAGKAIALNPAYYVVDMWVRIA